MKRIFTIFVLAISFLGATTNLQAQSELYFTGFSATPEAPSTGNTTWTYATGGFKTTALTGWTDYDAITYPSYYLTTGSAGYTTLNFDNALTLTSNGTDCGSLVIHWGTADKDRTLYVKINGGTQIELGSVISTTYKKMQTATYTIPSSITSISSLNVYSAGGQGVYMFDMQVNTYPSGIAPTLTAETATVTSDNTATIDAQITDLGDGVTEYGVCWGYNSNPTTSDNVTTNGSLLLATAYSNYLTGLTAGSTYYARSYATGPGGTAYGTGVSFTTTGTCAAPTEIVTGTPVFSALSKPSKTSVTWGSFNLPADADSCIIIAAWNSTDQTGDANTTPEMAPVDGNNYDICTVWSSKSSYPKALVGSGWYCVYKGSSANIAVNMTGLSNGAYYVFKAFTYNSCSGSPLYNTADCVRDTILTSAPTVTTQAVTEITENTATGNATLASSPALVSTSGIVWSTSTTPVIESNNFTTDGGIVDGAYTAALTGLTSGTTYYVRAYATNGIGTSYGAEVSFTSSLPTNEKDMTNTSANIQIYSKNRNVISVISTPSNLIKEVSIFNEEGKLINKQTKLNASTQDFVMANDSKIYLVRVVTENNIKTAKVIIH